MAGKHLVIPSLILVLSAIGISTPDIVDSNATRIESVESLGSENFTGEVEVLSEDQYPDIGSLGVKIYEAFEVNLSQGERIEIELEEDQEWAENFIEENPSYFGGPGHHYTPGLYGVLKGEKLEHESMNHVNETIKTRISESGIYYIVFIGTHAERGTYVGPEGKCDSYLSSPGSQFEEVEKCTKGKNHFIKSKINHVIPVLGVLISISAIFLSLRLFKYVKHKLLIRKINEKARKIEKENDEEARKLYDAMDLAMEGKYSKASELLENLDY